MKNLFNRKDCDAIMHRVNTVSPIAERAWGKMEVNQMIIHLKDQFDIALGNIPAAAQGPFIFRTSFGRVLILYLLPWRKGKDTTPREMDATLKGMVVTDFESDKHLLITRINEFIAAKQLAPHPFFGKLNQRAWGRLAWKHMNHHLVQFGA